MTREKHSVVVAQRGSREHYLVSRALSKRGMLAALVTDFYMPPSVALFSDVLKRFATRKLRRAMGRRAVEIPDHLVHSCPLRTLVWSAGRHFKSRANNAHEDYLILNSAFASWVAGLPLPNHDVFFGYSYASLEALQAEKQRGVLTILDQFDPGETEDKLVREESAKWPTYVAKPPPPSKAYYDRVRREWELADVILTHSEWTRQCLIGEGIPETKMVVLPSNYEPPAASTILHKRRVEPEPLRVLWIGSVNIRKGIPYLIEAARLLQDEAVEFTVAGPLGIKQQAVREAPSNIRWLGQVPRKEVSELYRNHHVFVLPTISDGFAITQIEALAHGLPVIVTPNCAHIIEDAETGVLIPPFSVEGLAQAIERFLQTPVLLEKMSQKCLQAARKYSVDAYASRLVDIITLNFAGR